jgi:quinol monooxygenase YgiN
MSEVIVQGAFILDPDDRDRFVEASLESMRSSRQEAGCVEYVMAADPLDPERVILSERWESMEHLREHLAQLGTGGRNTDARPTPRDVQVTFYEATAASPPR